MLIPNTPEREILSIVDIASIRVDQLRHLVLSVVLVSQPRYRIRFKSSEILLNDRLLRLSIGCAFSPKTLYFRAFRRKKSADRSRDF